jgi:putative flippase GtrA
MVKNIESADKTAENKKSFFRFQITALLATSIDFSVTILFKEILGFHYSLAVAIGATCGAVTAFTINRYWVFRALEKHPAEQAFRYMLVAAGSVVLNTAGTYLVTETLRSPYLVSKAVTAMVIGFTYSYYFSKRFVFYA